MSSLRFNISMLKPQVVVIQETKIKQKSQIDLAGYRCFPSVRGDSGGGVLIACVSSLDPVLIHEGDAECEVMVVQIKINDNPTKCLPEGKLPSGRQVTSHLREKVS